MLLKSNNRDLEGFKNFFKAGKLRMQLYVRSIGLAIGLKGLFLIVLGLSFYRVAIANPSQVVISEIKINGETTLDEFIELYNPTGTDISLNQWRLSKKTATGSQSNLVTSFPAALVIKSRGYLLIAHKNYKSGKSPDIFYSVSTASVAEDNTILLYSDDGKTLVDKIGFGTAQDKELVAAVNPEKHQSLERYFSNNIQDTDNNSLDFFIQNKPNPQNTSDLDGGLSFNKPSTTSESSTLAKNETSTTVKPSDSINENNAKLVSAEPLVGDVVINEFMANTSNAQDEWIELYNTTDKRIGLNGSYLEDGSGEKIQLYDFLEPGGHNKFLTIYIKSGYLNNDGDSIVLKNKNGVIIDKVAYGDFDDGNINDNADAQPKDLSMARIKDGLNSNHNRRDFKLTFAKTPNAGNIILVDNNINESRSVRATDYQVVINEVLPNPLGSDSEQEFVELKNLGSNEINLNGWILANTTGEYKINNLDFKDTIIKSQGFLVVYSKITKLQLNNKSDTVKLYANEINTNGRVLVDVLAYSQVASTNQSYSRINSNTRSWTLGITPNQDNVLIFANQSPKAILTKHIDLKDSHSVLFDGSGSYDPDGDDLEYFLDFGDGTISNNSVEKHKYLKGGNYNVKLLMKDTNGGSDTETLLVSIIDSEINKEVDKNLVPPVNIVLNNFDGQQDLKKLNILEESKTSEPKPVSISDIEKEPKKQLVSIKGLVNRVNGRGVYVEDDDSEVRVYFQKNNFKEMPKILKGDSIFVAGYIDRNKNLTRILPRNLNDLKIQSVKTGNTSEIKNELQYNPIEKEIKLNISNDNSHDDNQYKIYFYVTLIALIFISGFVVYNQHKKV